MTKDRQLSLGERLLLGLTALFLCFLFVLNMREAGKVVRAAPRDVLAQADSATGGMISDSASGGTLSNSVSGGTLSNGASGGTLSNGADSSVSSHGVEPGKLDLNTASASELETLPGIGPALAARIVEYRTEHGPFPTIEAVMEVSGIGTGKFSAMEPYLYVSAVKADEAP